MSEEDFNSKKIERATVAISHLIENSLGNLNIEQMEIIKNRHKLLLDQQIFWISQSDPNRFAKDLMEYANWLCDFIGDAERDFWAE
tara:strand:+ start:152 stop:409 length:258 start_codon:yes stop_codon:yes gene_type:complete